MSESEDPDWSSDLIYAFRIMSNYASQDLTKRLAPTGITLAEFNILDTLSGAAISPSELANTLGTGRGAVTKIVGRLVKKSLVKRRAHKEDGYLQILTLTRKGFALIPKLRELSVESNDEIFKWLINEDRAHLDRIMLELVRRYRKDHGLD